MELHYRLAFEEEGNRAGWPMFYVFNTCKHFIRTIPSQVYSEVDPEDVDTDGEDHPYDDVRYMCQRNPIAPRKAIPQKAKQYNPLDDTPTQYGRYDFYNVKV